MERTFLAADIQRIDLDNGYAEDLLDCLLDFDLVCVLSDFKSVLLDVQVFHGLLGDDRTNDYIISGLHHAYTSSIFASAALETTSLRLLRIM